MENYLMNYDTATGNILGFYIKSIHGDNIPIPAKEVTPEKHDFYMQNNGKYKLNITTLEDELIPVPQSSQVNLIKAQLAELDTVLPRCVEDLITAQGMDVSKLPQIMQDRLSQKQSLRQQLSSL